MRQSDFIAKSAMLQNSAINNVTFAQMSAGGEDRQSVINYDCYLSVIIIKRRCLLIVVCAALTLIFMTSDACLFVGRFFQIKY